MPPAPDIAGGLPFPQPNLRDPGILLRPWTGDDVPAIVAACSVLSVARRMRSHMLIMHSQKRRDSLIYGLLPGELT